MNTIRRLVMILAVWAAGIGPRLAAQDAVQPRSTGRVLLLQSDSGLEGDIEKIGEQFRIRRGNSEVWLTGEKVLRLCGDWEDAYAFMKTRANLGDPDERLRLARWCQLNNLRPQALIEAQAALEMRPGHAESRQLVTMMTRSAAAAPSTAAKAAAAMPGHASVAPPPTDISSDSFGLFATRVQPILMNTCVTCHSGGRGGNFQLFRTEGAQRGYTQANLAAVVEQLNLDNPVLSPLLIKAVSRHGDAAKAPLNDRQAVPFQTLQGWIEHLLANNPHLRHASRETGAATPSAPQQVAFAQTQALTPVRNKPMAISRPLPRPELPKESAPPQVSSPAVAGNSEPQINPLDPFDPVIFNQHIHPLK